MYLPMGNQKPVVVNRLQPGQRCQNWGRKSRWSFQNNTSKLGMSIKALLIKQWGMSGSLPLIWRFPHWPEGYLVKQRFEPESWSLLAPPAVPTCDHVISEGVGEALWFLSAPAEGRWSGGELGPPGLRTSSWPPSRQLLLRVERERQHTGCLTSVTLLRLQDLGGMEWHHAHPEREPLQPALALCPALEGSVL